MFCGISKVRFHSLGLKPDIEYIEMPEKLKANYQYFTEAKISKLREIGYKKDFYTVNQGIYDYITSFLEKNYKIY